MDVYTHFLAENHFVTEDMLELDRKHLAASEPAGNDQEQDDDNHPGNESEEQEIDAERKGEDLNLKEENEKSKGAETKKAVKKPKREEYKVIR